VENATRKANSGRGSEREDGEELGDDEGSNWWGTRRVGEILFWSTNVSILMAMKLHG